MATSFATKSPEPSAQSVRLLDTPLGDRDRSPKVQLCLEIRDKEVKKNGTKGKRTQQVLEVTVLYVKHLPKNGISQQVKLRLHHQLKEEIYSTDIIKPGESDARYIECHSFPFNIDYLEGTTLQLQVCDKKATRNTKSLGEVQLNLDHLKLNHPVCQWYKLDAPK